MDSSINKCSGCYWYEQCGGELPCDDFTPLDGRDDISFYHQIIKENSREYRSLLEEVNPQDDLFG